jgi:hypothetical protein
MLLSAVYPTAGGCTRSFTADEGVWYLPAQDVALLRSAAHPLAMLVPGLRLQVHCPNPQGAEAAPGAHRGYSHLASFSVPLAACLKDIMAKNVCSVQRETCEDGMRYQMDVALDPRGLSLSGLQQVSSEMQKGLDQVLHHQSLVSQTLGTPLRSVEQLVAEAAALRQQRTEACQRVLEAVSPDTKCNFNLNLQYGRAFGMQVDQQQCRALREGSVLSHGFEQTLLHLTVAEASLVAKLAQEANLPLQSSLAVEQYLGAQPASTLWHGTLQQVQLGFTCRTSYHSDPSFGPTLKVAQAMRNADGSMTVRVVPTFGLVNGPGEDQNLTPGTTYADVAPDPGGQARAGGGNAGGARWQGGAPVFGGPAGPADGPRAVLHLRDCEDGAMHINACNDVLRMHALEVLLAQQAAILQMLPPDVQAVGGSILKVTEALHAHVNAGAPPPRAVELPLLTAKTFTDALGKARAAPPRAQLYSTSLLASAPQLASAPLAGATADPSAKLGCCAKEYNAWWTSALMQGDKQANLNGHAVAIALGLSPVLRTHVQDTPVDVHLIAPSMKVFESTAPAWQTDQADTALVKLDLKKEPCTPIRIKLQNDLDHCAPLTMCMACNVRSALHTAETRQVIAQALDPKLRTGDPMAPATARLDAGSLPSMIPLQTFSLRAQADSEQELSRQLAFKFYKTLLAVGDGAVYSLDQHPTTASVSVYAGASIARELPNTASLVVGSPLSPAERKALHALGALQSTFLLTAAETLASAPPLMPLALQQRLRFRPDGQLVPLSGSELRAVAHPCGMLAQTPLLPVTHASSAQDVLENLTAMVSMAKQVVGPDLHVTGSPFADGLFLTFP